MRILELWVDAELERNRTMWGLQGDAVDPGEWKRLEFVYPSTLPRRDPLSWCSSFGASISEASGATQRAPADEASRQPGEAAKVHSRPGTGKRCARA